MRHHALTQPRHRRSLAPRLILALAVAAVAGCGEHNPTEPMDTGDEPAVASLGGDENPAAPAEAIAAATRLPRSFYMNPISGSDANPGTKLKPFKTLAHGLALAITGDSMRLASGVYSKATNGEKFTTGTQQVTVPAGVTILGTSAEDFTSRLQGATGDSYGLDLKGGATVKNLVVSGFPVGIRAMQGAQTLKTVILDQNRLGLDLRGSAKAMLTGNSKVFLNPSNLTGTIMGANLGQQAQLIVIGGMISGEGQNCRTDVKGIILNDASRLTMSGSALLQDIAGNALSLRATSKATLTRSAIVRSFTQLAGGCTPAPSVVTQDSASLTLRKGGIASLAGTNSIGIQSSSRGLLTLDSAQVFGHTGAGIKALTEPRVVVKSGSLINGNNVGIDVPALFSSNITITGAVVTSNTIGIRAPFLKLRGSKVSFNQTGIVLTSQHVIADLGLPSAPGNNTIKDNSITGVKFDLFFADDLSHVSAFASGNTWNPSIQGSDGSGHYAVNQTMSGPNSGKNFQLDEFDFRLDF